MFYKVIKAQHVWYFEVSIIDLVWQQNYEQNWNTSANFNDS